MIGVSSSSRSFRSVGRYLVTAKDGPAEERVAWTSARNLPSNDPDIAVKVMRATASQNVRSTQPVYHLALSFDPRDAVDRATMERVADRVLTELRLKEHQALIVAHGDRRHPHVHILVNRIHPESGKAWDRWQDYAAIQRALREEERALGLRQVESRENEPRGRAAEEPRAIAAVRADLDTYARVSETAERRYAAETDLMAARARLSTFEVAVQRMERSGAAFDGELQRVYRRPAVAKDAFLAAAEARGVKEAADTMRKAPERYGALQMSETRGRWGRQESSDTTAREAAGVAASRAVEFIESRREVARSAELQAVDGKGVAQHALAIDPAHTAHRQQISAAETRVQERQAEASSLPKRDDIEYRLRQGLRRLSPPEFEQLRLTLSGHRLAVACRLRQLVRDAALGRDRDE